MSKTVHLVVYTHKHGQDFAVAQTEASAWRIAAGWAYEAVVVEDRFDGRFPELAKMAQTQPEDASDDVYKDVDAAFVAKYVECERETFGVEDIEVHAMELVS